MKKLHLFILLTLAFLSASAQKVYFVYIQTEAEQPFLVKINQKTQLSSQSGYIILPKLHDSSYNFSVAFPREKWPEQKFSVAVNKKDHGYMLKNFPDKGWGLYDLQTMEIQMAANTATTSENVNTNTGSVTPFTEVLAKAADDPSLKEKIEKETKSDTAVIKPEVKQAENSTISTDEKKEIKTDTIIKEPVSRVEENKEPENKNYKASTVSKYSESSMSDGFGLVYIDHLDNGSKDTIRLVIPNPKPVVEQLKEEPKEEKKFIEVNTPGTNNSTSPITNSEPAKNNEPEKIAEPETKKVNTPSTHKPSCTDLASEDEFVKLRKRMAGEKEANMLDEAKKYMKSKCYSSNQIQVLGRLFETDEARYDFFDYGYKHVFDPENYSSLQSDFKDPYYSGRFKAMLRN